MRLRNATVVIVSTVLGFVALGLTPAAATSCEGGRPLLDAVEDVDRTITWRRPETAVKKPQRLVRREGISASVIVENWDHYPLTGTTEIQGIVGVYEQETVAAAPALLFVQDEVSVSTVTRYWGEPPQNLGLQARGGELFRPILSLLLGGEDPNPCLSTSPVGAVEYGSTDPDQGEKRDGRQLRVGLGEDGEDSRFGPLTASEEAALEARFGPPIVVSTPLASVRAFLWVWAVPILFTSVVVLLVWALVKRRRHHVDRQQDREALTQR